MAALARTTRRDPPRDAPLLLENTLPISVHWQISVPREEVLKDTTPADTRDGMARVLRRLERVDEAEATRRRAAARAVLDAFVFRPPDPRPSEHPSAADFLLGELCVAAQAMRNQRPRHTTRLIGPVEPRCVL